MTIQNQFQTGKVSLTTLMMLCNTQTASHTSSKAENIGGSMTAVSRFVRYISVCLVQLEIIQVVKAKNGNIIDFHVEIFKEIKWL
jgi:hypothetical protein